MYKSFRVKNFRCFKDLQINDLGRVNLIAGKNNTGKTALLEAMYAFSRPLSPWALLQTQNARGIDIPDDDFPLYWKQYFFGMDSSCTIRIEATGPHVAEGSSLTIKELRNDGTNNDDFLEYYRRRRRALTLSELLEDVETREKVLKFRLNWSSASEPLVVYFGDQLKRNSVKELQSESRFIPVIYRVTEEQIANRFSQLAVDEKLDHLTDELSRLEPRLTRIHVLSPWGKQMLWAECDGVSMPLRLLGEGTNRICHFLMTMMAVKPPFLFIDEIENGIHHSVQKDIWQAIGRVAREQDIQVFTTTHSYEMIEAAHEAFKDDDLDDFRFHRLYHDSTTGKIEARTYNDFSMNAALSREYEVRG